ncbi:MAG: 2-oxoacid:acceptor oxidoreductase family protein [Acidimicrobiales bacterium]
MQIEVLLTGIGGQGVQLCAKALAMAATADGRQAMLSARYGGEMRGGQTEASVVVADTGLRSLPILPSAGSAYVMHHQYWPPVRARLRSGAPVVLNTTVIGPPEDLDGASEFLTVGIPATAMAAEAGAPMAAGFVLLGAYASLTSVASIDSIVAAMTELVPAYRREHIQANEAAIRAGAAAIEAGAADLWVMAGR